MLINQARAPDEGRVGASRYYPWSRRFTDNGAMIALLGALRLARPARGNDTHTVSVRPRWPLDSLGCAVG